MTYDDRSSRYGDSRVDDYWYHRYRQIDAEYASAEAVRQGNLDRWTLDVGGRTAPVRRTGVRSGEPPRPSRGQQIQEIARYFERAQASISACAWLSEHDRDFWLTRLRAVDLFDDAACDTLKALHDDVEHDGEGVLRSLASPWAEARRNDVRFTLLNVTTDLTLLASACLQLQGAR